MPYVDAASVAVVGTLAGVALSAAAALAGTLVSQRSQQVLAREQLRHQSSLKTRDELREAFVSYLEAYDSAFLLAQQVAAQRTSDSGEQIQWAVVAAEEMGRLRRAYLVLTIAAGPEVRQASNDCLGAIWSMGESAAVGDNEGFVQAIESSNEPRDRLRETMRRQLDVS
jgi:hypothetical protein